MLIIKIIFLTILPTPQDWIRQGSVWLASPWQYWPLFKLGGSSHSLVLVRFPSPQDALQDPQTDHRPQCPSIGAIRRNLLFEIRKARTIMHSSKGFITNYSPCRLQVKIEQMRIPGFCRVAATLPWQVSFAQTLFSVSMPYWSASGHVNLLSSEVQNRWRYWLHASLQGVNRLQELQPPVGPVRKKMMISINDRYFSFTYYPRADPGLVLGGVHLYGESIWWFLLQDKMLWPL